MQEAADGVSEGHRALVRQPGEWLSRTNRLEVVRGRGRRQGADLDRQDAVRAASTADLEQVLEVLHRLGGPQQGECALELVDAHYLGQVAAHQGDPVIGGQLALPAVRLDLECLTQGRCDASLSDPRILFGSGGRWRQLIHPALTHDHRRRRTELRDVCLAPADGDRDDAHPGAPGNPQLAALMEEAAVGVGQRLAQGAQRPGRQVVVVVVLQGLESLRRGAPNRGVATRHLRQQEEAPLGPDLRAHRGLAEAQDVPRVSWSLLRHREADSGCESIRHGASPGVRWMRTECGPGRCRL